MGTELNISSWRYITISIGRRYLYEVFSSSDGEALSYGDSNIEDEDAVSDYILDL